MAVDVSAELPIARAPADVAAYAMDPAHDPSWIGGVVEAEQLTQGTLAPGTRVRRVAKFLGRRIDYTTEVADFSPPSALAMSTEAPFPMRIRYEFAADGGGTRSRVRVQGEPRGFFRLAEPVLARQVRHNVTKDLRRLKAILESS
jgi:hypothetical protein